MEIPGVRPTVGYISLRELTPQQFAQMIIQKLELGTPTSSSLINALAQDLLRKLEIVTDENLIQQLHQGGARN